MKELVNLTKEQQDLIPDMLKLMKLAAEMNLKIEAISTYRLRSNAFTVDYQMELLGTDCYSSPLLYKLKLKE
jgi:hypothetical protein